MCRLISLVGRDISSYIEYVDSFVKASRCDPFLMELLGRTECEGHSDGWGYAIVGARDGKWSLSSHYRTTLPVYYDSTGINNLKNIVYEISVGILIAHSRRLAEGSARTGNTHPIHYNWKGFEMWIAHNGVMDSSELSKELGIPKLLDTTDTYYLGEYLYRHLTGVRVSDLVEALRRAAKYTKTAMNTLIILYDDRKLVLSITSYLTEDRLRNPLTVNYYRIVARTSNNSSAFFSSSIARYIHSPDTAEVPLQSAVVMELDPEAGRLSKSTYNLD
ncbi:MAG: class II glutamine amidotransferase [Sulfolobales archaeon]